jgi:hypothetical protein
MTERPPEAVKLPRRFMWAHPCWAVLGSLEGILFAGIGAAFYVLIMSWPIIAHIPALNPLVAIWKRGHVLSGARLCASS